ARGGGVRGHRGDRGGGSGPHRHRDTDDDRRPSQRASADRVGELRRAHPRAVDGRGDRRAGAPPDRGAHRPAALLAGVRPADAQPRRALSGAGHHRDAGGAAARRARCDPRPGGCQPGEPDLHRLPGGLCRARAAAGCRRPRGADPRGGEHRRLRRPGRRAGPPGPRHDPAPGGRGGAGGGGTDGGPAGRGAARGRGRRAIGRHRPAPYGHPRPRGPRPHVGPGPATGLRTASPTPGNRPPGTASRSRSGYPARSASSQVRRAFPYVTRAADRTTVDLMKMSNDLEKKFQAQITLEFAASITYRPLAIEAAAQDLPGIAEWLRHQADEQTVHANKGIPHVSDRGNHAAIGAIEAPGVAPGLSVLGIFEAALAHEEKVSESIRELYRSADKEGDYDSRPLLNWFVDEQIEE